MIQAKLKKCAGCNELKYIWKSHGKEKYCKQCWYEIEKPKSISPVSKKRQGEMDTYGKLKEAFLYIKPNCEAKLVGCTIKSTDVHHLYSGKDRNKYYLKINTWKAVCRNCHSYIHDNLSSEEAIEMGLKLSESHFNIDNEEKWFKSDKAKINHYVTTVVSIKDMLLLEDYNYSNCIG